MATVRSVEAKRLSSLVRGDLDWIVMKTLEKDRNKRYASASELADDINRHLHEEPVVARPPSAHDRLSKLIRRNRGKFAISTVLLAIAIGSAAWFYYSATQRAKEVTFRTQQLESAMNDASLSLVQAETSAIGNDAPWNTAAAQIARVQDLLDQGKSEPATIDRAKDMIADFRISSERRQIATQIEEVVMHGATNPALESWQRMEADMREFFRKHGFNIGHEKPMAIGQRIRNHRFSVLWADLLELWIATRGQMSSIGGEKMTEKTMQPWAEAIYEADADPVRTGIRRFIYEGPPRTRGKLDRLVEDVDLTVLPPRTLSWLATTYGMAGANDEAERILEIALIQYPKDFMLAFDTGLFFASQQRWEEAARMYHRCIPIRDDVAGIWSSLATALDKLGDPEAAARARARAEKLTGE